MLLSAAYVVCIWYISKRHTILRNYIFWSLLHNYHTYCVMQMDQSEYVWLPPTNKIYHIPKLQMGAFMRVKTKLLFSSPFVRVNKTSISLTPQKVGEKSHYSPNSLSLSLKKFSTLPLCHQFIFINKFQHSNYNSWHFKIKVKEGCVIASWTLAAFQRHIYSIKYLVNFPDGVHRNLQACITASLFYHP